MRSGSALLALVWLSSSASAQTQVRPRVILMVDTSGSMLDHLTDNNSTGGDGSTSYTDGVVVRTAAANGPGYTPYSGYQIGAGTPICAPPPAGAASYDGQNSRMGAAKSAINNVLNASGDIDWGLMRYSGNDCGFSVASNTDAEQQLANPAWPSAAQFPNPNQAFSNKVCANNGQCTSNICNATTGHCRCTGNADCINGTTCDLVDFLCKCASNAQCPATGACNTTTGMCECTTNAQCASNSCATTTGMCRCSNNNQCVSNSCFTNSGQCRCTNNNQCPSGSCNTNNGECLCTAGAQCPSGSCNAVTGECNCTANAHCQSNSCNVATGQCNCTNNNQCPSGSCNTTTHECLCSANNQCPSGSCNVPTGQCNCNNNNQCPSNSCDIANARCLCTTGAHCKSGTCTVATGLCACNNDFDCGVDEFCIAGVCKTDAGNLCGGDYGATDTRGSTACGAHGNFATTYNGTCGTGGAVGAAGCTTPETCYSDADCGGGAGHCQPLAGSAAKACTCTVPTEATDCPASWTCGAGNVCVFNLACQTIGGTILVDPSAGGYTVAQNTPWIDGVEDHRDDGTGHARNPELRAVGNTPLAGAARSMTTWYKTAVAADAKGTCRPYILVQMTDGVDTCEAGSANDGPVAAAQGVVAATIPGAKNLNKVYVIGLAFGGAASPVLDAVAAAGGTNAARYANSPAEIQAALADIVASSVLVEKCNNADDDCNGACDEPFPDVAVTGVGCSNPHPATNCDNGQVPGTKCFATGTYVCAANGLSETCSAQTCATNPALCATAETCNGLDDDCNGVIDDCTPFVPGSCCTSSCPACNTAGVPQAETCNGCDDDCDGTIDNHLVDTGFACGVAVGICTAGTTACCQEAMPAVGSCTTGSVANRLVCLGGTGPKAETCNATDDDCDGIKDDNIAMNGQPCTGAGVNTTGICKAAYTCTGVAGSGPNGLTCVQTVGPAPETCNGLDDDCDGTPDDHLTEPWPGTACCPSSTGALTDCCITGTWQCVAGAKTCIGATIKGVEVCNGLDDDCDGTVDNNIIGDGAPCSGAGIFTTGECKAQFECTGTAGPGPNGLTCVQLIGPTVETCNGLDDDCDGTPDDNLVDPRVGVVGGAPCLPLVPLSGTTFPGGVAQPPCNPGTTVCVAGAVQCTGEVFPQPNQCDGISIDCTGMVNTNGNCQTGFQCYQGTCLSQCGNGEFPCPGGFVCINTTATDPGICIPDVCVTMPCAAGLICTIDNNGNRTCVDPCTNVDCPTGFRCQSGACVDDTCRTFGCPMGQICSGNPPTCMADPCAGVTCPPTQYCDGSGTCVSECIEGQCPSGQICVDGGCVTDPCADVHCFNGLICIVAGGVGACADSMCGTSDCNAGTVCCGGQCQTDPCLALQCPDNAVCVVRDTCQAVCEVPAPPAMVQIVPAGGGGFSCDVGHNDPRGALLLVVLAVVALMLRRNKKQEKSQ